MILFAQPVFRRKCKQQKYPSLKEALQYPEKGFQPV